MEGRLSGGGIISLEWREDIIFAGFLEGTVQRYRIPSAVVPKIQENKTKQAMSEEREGGKAEKVILR